MTYWDEIGRKAIHLSSAAFPLVYYYTSCEFMLWVLVPLVAFALIVETLRQFVPAVEAWIQRWLGNIMRREEKRLFTGATYVVISVLIMIALFPREIAITALLFMSISDALASLIGIKFGGTWRFLGKSVAGSSRTIGWWAWRARRRRRSPRHSRYGLVTSKSMTISRSRSRAAW